MIFDRFRLDNQVALVTGSSRGIGLAIASALRDAGAQVILSSSSGRADADAAFGVDCHYIQADLSEPGAALRLVGAAIEAAGRLDILVNNAGVALGDDTERFSDADYRRVMTVNLDSVYEACKAALPGMRSRRHGVILNIGSISGLIANVPQHLAAYGASKAAVHLLTRSLANEYAPHGIRVNCIAPGYIETQMTRGSLADPETYRQWIELTPMRRIGSPADIAAAALYLCSPAAGFVTGEVLVVDGGYLAR